MCSSTAPSFLLFSLVHFFLLSVCQSSHPTLLLTFTPSETLYRPRKTPECTLSTGHFKGRQTCHPGTRSTACYKVCKQMNRVWVGLENGPVTTSPGLTAPYYSLNLCRNCSFPLLLWGFHLFLQSSLQVSKLFNMKSGLWITAEHQCFSFHLFSYWFASYRCSVENVSLEDNVSQNALFV